VLWAHGSATESHSWACFPGADPHKVPIDSNGNLTSKTEGTDTWGYEWNALNQLTRVTKNSVEQARFSYDPKGRRVEKVAGGVTTTWTYEGRDIVREVRGGATLKYIQGLRMDEALAEENAAGALTYFHAYGLGSIIKNSDSTGSVAGGDRRLGAAAVSAPRHSAASRPARGRLIWITD
jgi:YD repeat-containing protein